MTLISVCACAMFAMAAFAGSAEGGTTRPTTSPATRTSLVRIVAIGDSITKGVRPKTALSSGVKRDEIFTARVEVALSAAGIAVEMFNAGIGGNRSDQGLARFDADVLSHRPNIVLILYGANDQVYETGAEGPRVPVEAYAENLSQMVQRTRAAGATPVLMTPLPLGSHWQGPKHAIYEGGKNNNAAMPKYVDAVRDVAKTLDVPLVDLAARWAKESPETIDAWEPDGVHPLSQGHVVIAEEIGTLLLKVVAGESR